MSELPRIFRGVGEATSPFNTVVIPLSLHLESSLKWDEEKNLAQRYVEKGFSLLWELNFGLPDAFHSPLGPEGALLSFEIAVEHFERTLGQPFKESTLGAILYSGPLLTVEAFDALKIITAALEETTTPFLLLQADSLEELLSFYALEGVEMFSLALKGHSLPHTLGWDGPSPYGHISSVPCAVTPAVKTTTALLLPPQNAPKRSWQWAAKVFQESTEPLKIIPEHLLTLRWEGVERLWIYPDTLSLQGKRRVQGFIAAEGMVLDILRNYNSLPVPVPLPLPG